MCSFQSTDQAYVLMITVLSRRHLPVRQFITILARTQGQYVAISGAFGEVMSYSMCATSNVGCHIRQVDGNTWLIGGVTLSRSPNWSDTATWNDESDGASYTVAHIPLPPPQELVPLDSPHIKLAHSVANRSFVWAIGQHAFCKVKRLEPNITLEWTTLEYVKSKGPRFEVPEVLFHLEDNSWSYLFLRRLPGRTLDSAWPTLSDTWRSYYMDTVVNACQEMAKWEGPQLAGVDGKNIPEYYLKRPENSEFNLGDACKSLGLYGGPFVFYHADLGPGNIIVKDEPQEGTIGIIDYEIAGFLPRGWILTKFRVSSGMDLSYADDPKDFRREVARRLRLHGYEDYTEAFNKWFR